MRIILGTAGSRGDVIPVLEVAAQLQRRGHDVEVFIPPHFDWAATERRLRARHFATDSQQLMQSLDHGVKSSKQTLEWARRAMLDQFEVLLPAAAGADALVTMVNELGAPTVAEHHRIPHYRLCCVPALVGDQPPAVTPFQRFPVPVNRLLWQGVDVGTQLIFGKALNAKRAELGLSRVRRFSAYAAGYSHNILAVDPVLVPPGRGWRFRYEYAGYPFGGDDGPLPPAVEEFLAAGPAPVYFGFGSVCVPEPEAVTKMILRAVAHVGCRAVIDQGWAGLGRGLERELPPDVLLIREVPHRRLFPRMAALVHHGGSGTTHGATRAGVPQAIAPQIIDQYFWGNRIYDLGLGPRPVPFTQLTESKLIAMLEGLLGPTYANHARVVAALVRVDGVGAVADIIERDLAERSGAEPGRATAVAAAV